jgi:2-polyprenyl-6-methoxyphenol hydroxylase-like FAD-dependent oxidoreductase
VYVLIAGGGKIGANLARTLLRAGHEVTLIEQRRDRFERLEDEFEHVVVQGDASGRGSSARRASSSPPPATTRTTSSSASSPARSTGSRR